MLLMHTAGSMVTYRKEMDGGDCLQTLAIGMPHGPVVCVHNGFPVLRDEWAGRVTLSGDTVVFVQLPLGGGGGGGGSNPMQTILTVAVMAAAVVSGQWYLAAYGTTFMTAAGVTAYTTGSLIASGLVSAGVMIGGGLLVNQLAPTPRMPTPELSTARGVEAASPTYSMQPASNSARLYQIIREKFGTNLTTPDLIAEPWWEYEGNEQYVYQLLGNGVGSYQIHEVRIADTAIWKDGEYTGNFPEVTLEFVPEGQAVTLFPDNVETSDEVSGQELRGPNVDGANNWVGAFAVNSAGTECTKIALDLIFNGLGYMTSNGMSTVSVGVRADFRRIDDLGTPVSDWAILKEKSISGATRDPLRITWDVDVPAGRYEVMMRRTTNKSTNGQVLDRVVWANMRAFLPSKQKYAQDVIAVKARASDSLSQAASKQFKVIDTRMLPLYDRETRTWSEPQPTRNWAAAMSEILRARHGGNQPESQIDLDTLWRLGYERSAEGELFDYVVDTGITMHELIQQASRTVSVITRHVGTMTSFVRDEAERPVRSVFTPHNILRGTFKRDFILHTDETPDHAIIEYMDRDTWTMRDVPAVLPDNLTEQPANKRFMGITSRAHAYREGMKELRIHAFRNETIEFDVELESRLALRGDVASISHPEFDYSSWGEVVEARPLLSLELDKAPEFAAGAELYLELRRPNGKPWGPCKVASLSDDIVILDEEDLGVLLAQGAGDPFEWLRTDTNAGRTVWRMGIGRNFAARVIITDVTPRGMYHAKIAAVVDALEVYEPIGAPPPWNPGTNLPSNPDAPEVTDLIVRVGGTAEAPTLALNWRPSAGAVRYVVQWSTDGNTWQTAAEPTVNSATVVVTPGQVSARVAAVGKLQGPWQTWTGTTDIQPPLMPAPVLAQPYAGGVLNLAWAAIAGAEEYVVTVLHGGTEVRAIALSGTAWTYAADLMHEDGGPKRAYSLRLLARNQAGDSAAGTLDVNDPVPSVPVNISGSATASSITISWTPVPGDVTGYIGLRGATSSFAATAAVETKTVSAASVTFSDLAPDTDHYFRIVAKDAFADLTGVFDDLTPSAVITVRTLAE
jgi:hypothetical protein